MGRIRVLALAVSIMVTTLAPVGPSTAASERGVTTKESDCYEVPIFRAVATERLRPLVPDRYALQQLNPVASRVLVTTYTCMAVSVDGRPGYGATSPSTVSIGSAAVTSRDGVVESAFYVLWYATDNPVLFAKLQQTGLPVTFLPRSKTSVRSGAGASTVQWSIRGGGLDYDVTAVGTEPDSTTSASDGVWYYDGPEGDVRISYDNRLRPPSTAVVAADFTGNETLAPLLVSPSVIPGVTFPFVRGGWSSRIDHVD